MLEEDEDGLGHCWVVEELVLEPVLEVQGGVVGGAGEAEDPDQAQPTSHPIPEGPEVKVPFPALLLLHFSLSSSAELLAEKPAKRAEAVCLPLITCHFQVLQELQKGQRL
jgi:hypothetical protein